MLRMLVWLVLISQLVACSNGFSEIDKDKEIILMRKIGDKIMKYAKDSTSSLKPIQEIDERNYLLEFNTPFSFVSDSVINIIGSELSKVDKFEYVVKVHSCDQQDLVFSYYISPADSSSLMSCMGRTQGKDCYLVEVKFLDSHNDFELGWSLLLLIPIVGGIWFWLKKRNLTNSVFEEKEAPSGRRIGKFLFDFEGQSLMDGEAKQTLTYKESKVMKVLSDHINEVVEREELSRLVWEEDGIVVGRSLDMFISKLRKKLISDEHVEIKNIHGIGYKLMVS